MIDTPTIVQTRAVPASPAPGEARVGGSPARTALVFGAGALGGPAALALAAGGVERLVLLDADPVEPNDLAVQPLLAEADLGRARGAALAAALASRFPELEVSAPQQPLGGRLLSELLPGAQVAVEATSRFADMFLVNDAAASAGIPLVHGALLGHSAQLLSLRPGVTGCLRCLFEGPPPCPEPPGPVPAPLGPLAGFVGSLLGVEALRLLTGTPGAYAGRLLAYEARSGWARPVPLRRRPGCPACGGLASGAAGDAPAGAAP